MIKPITTRKPPCVCSLKTVRAYLRWQKRSQKVHWYNEHIRCLRTHSQSRKGETEVLHWRFDGLRALITKMCCERELPMKRSSRIVSVPKSTHYENWTRLLIFLLFPQTLNHHLGINAWYYNPCCRTKRPLGLFSLLSVGLVKYSTVFSFVYLYIFAVIMFVSTHSMHLHM